MSVTAVVFDIGNVLLPFDLNRSVERILAKCEHRDEEHVAALVAEKDSLECGEVNSSTFFDRITEHLGFRGSRDEMLEAWEDIFSPNKAMWDFVHQAAGRFPLYLLSNTNGPHVRYMFRTYPVFSNFEDGVYSHEAKCAKPDGEIFRIAEERFDLVTATTVYLDDLAENVAAAKERGWDALVYDLRDHGAFTEAMKIRGVL